MTERDCLRNVQRRTGRPIPPSAESIAKTLADEELADLIRGLEAILVERRYSA
jgi:hypothetical protein